MGATTIWRLGGGISILKPDQLASVRGTGTVSSGFANALRRGISAADQLRNDLAGANPQITYSTSIESQAYSLLSHYGHNYPGAADPATPIYWPTGLPAATSVLDYATSGAVRLAAPQKITFHSSLPLVPAAPPAQSAFHSSWFLAENRLDHGRALVKLATVSDQAFTNLGTTIWGRYDPWGGTTLRARRQSRSDRCWSGSTSLRASGSSGSGCSTAFDRTYASCSHAS